MKMLLLILPMFLISCSATKQLNNKWIGKTDQDVVKEFGLPRQVLNNNIKGKVYIYTPFDINGGIRLLGRWNNDGTVTFPTQTVNYEKKMFHFDSLNKVYLVEIKDSSYIYKEKKSIN